MIKKEYINKIICLKFYNSILKDLTKILKRTELSDVIDLQIMYEFLLYNGYLSLDEFEIKYYYKDETSDIIGMKVITGEGICRHITKMLSDLSKIYGYNVSNIVGSKDGMPVHLVNGVNYNGSKIVLDCTNKKVGYFSGENKIILRKPNKNNTETEYDWSFEDQQLSGFFNYSMLNYLTLDTLNKNDFNQFCNYYLERKNEIKREFLRIRTDLELLKNANIKRYEYICKNYDNIRDLNYL